MHFIQKMLYFFFNVSFVFYRIDNWRFREISCIWFAISLVPKRTKTLRPFDKVSKKCMGSSWIDFCMSIWLKWKIHICNSLLLKEIWLKFLHKCLFWDLNCLQNHNFYNLLILRINFWSYNILVWQYTYHIIKVTPLKHSWT